MISEVTRDSLEFAWPQVEPMVVRALEHGQGEGTATSEVLEGIQSGELSLWVVHEGDDITACLVLSVDRNIKGRKLFVEILAGQDMDLWADEVEKLLMDYRDLIGAYCIEASVRRGLAKFLTNRGWKQKAVIVELT